MTFLSTATLILQVAVKLLTNQATTAATTTAEAKTAAESSDTDVIQNEAISLEEIGVARSSTQAVEHGLEKAPDSMDVPIRPLNSISSDDS